jgi:arylformamidase
MDDVTSRAASTAGGFPGGRVIDITYELGVAQNFFCPPPKITTYFDPLERCYVTDLTLSSHTGTHMDAPYHHFPHSTKLSQIPVSRFVGRAQVFDLQVLEGPIPLSAVDKIPLSDQVSMVLLKTGGDKHWHSRADFEKGPYVTPEVAVYLADLPVGGIVMDCPVDKPGDFAYPNHKTLLGSGKFFVEYVTNLDEVDGIVGIVALPLKTTGGDGAPARVIAIV